MCGCGNFGGPPNGIPIEEETHALYSDELKAAWVEFDAWWNKAQAETPETDLIDRKSMPDDVREAMDLILVTPIPGFDEYTGADSCYMNGVQMQMTDPE